MTSIIGQYGDWAAGLDAGQLPKLSFRRPEFTDLTAWRQKARQCVLDRMGLPPAVAAADVRTLARATEDGLEMELLQWQLPYGPPTEALLLKPAGETRPLPGVLAFHDHSAKKYWGWKKIARMGKPHPLMVEHQDEAYSGRAWANELAHRGYVVLVPDAFLFGSRRVNPADCPEDVRRGCPQPTDADHAAIARYNDWSSDHEHIMAKSLFCAGTSWPAVFWREDVAALDYLASRPEVDAKHLGCGGLSGGGLRSVYLAGLDERIACYFTAGFMTTWRDLLLNKASAHTWMTYIPLLPRELDFPEILGLRAPAPSLVLSCNDDPLYTLEGMTAAADILRQHYAKAGAAERLKASFHPGPHKLDAAMQAEAFEWFDRWLT